MTVVRRVVFLQGLGADAAGAQGLCGREFVEIYTGLAPHNYADVSRIAQGTFGDVAREALDAGLVSDGPMMHLGDIHWPKPQALPDDTDIILTPRTRSILYRLLKAMLAGESVALIGRRAGGKTALVAYAAALLGQPFVQQVLSPGTDIQTLVGGFGPEGWRDGALLQLSRPDRAPGVLLLDECNMAPAAVLERLNAVLDDARTLTLPERDGEAVRLHEAFRLVCAMNPPGPRNPGRGRLSSAWRSRLTWIEVQDIAPDEEDAIAEGLAHKLEAFDPKGLTAAFRRFVTTQLRQVDAEQLSLRELCAAVRTCADLQNQMSVFDAFELALKTHYGAIWPDADARRWHEAALGAWPEAASSA